MTGPQEGTYAIQMSQFCVNLPENCSDDALILGDAKHDENLPTSMSFFLSRVRLAHLCREMTDVVPPRLQLKVPYEEVIAMDRKLQNFFYSLPVFFRTDSDCLEKTRPLELVYPKIPIMRYCILTAAYSRRCRLHQRFLLRQSDDARYIYSRQACLESAEAILELYQPQKGTDSPTAMAQMGIVMHCTHLALTVLVIDLCFNQTLDQANVKTLVSMAFRNLQEAAEVSPLLRKSLKTLKDMLRRHDAWTGETSAVNDMEIGPVQLEEMSGIHDPGAWLSSFQDIWESNGDELVLGDWDNLFSSLDSRPF
jgi:hypothetical protein